MKLLTLLLTLWAVSISAFGNTLVIVDFRESMRRLNSKVLIEIEDKGKTRVTSESHLKEPKINEFTLSPSQLAQIQKTLISTDWAALKKDKETGLDGSTVKISFQDHTVTLWALDSNTKERGLNEIQKMIQQLFELSGFDKEGFPK